MKLGAENCTRLKNCTYLHGILIDWQLHAGLAGTKVFTVPGCAARPTHAFNLLLG
jgi:hypothetical protein